jgi:hypothetical protein
VGRRKARPAAALKARDRSCVDQLVGEIGAEATPEIYVTSMLAVFDGQTCIGHLLLRGKVGIEAFNADTKSLGVFRDHRAAADIIAKAAGGKS